MTPLLIPLMNCTTYINILEIELSYWKCAKLRGKPQSILHVYNQPSHCQAALAKFIANEADAVCLHWTVPPYKITNIYYKTHSS